MPSTLLTLDDDKKPLLKPNERLVIRNFGQEKQFKAHLLPVPGADEPGKKFTLFTDQVLDGPSGHGKAEVLFCTAFPLKKGASVSQLTYTIDLSQGNAAATRLACKGASDDVISLPASTRNSKYSFDDVPPFSYLQYNVEDLSEFQFVAVVERTDRPSPGWLVAEFSNKTDGLIAANVGLGRLLTRGLHVELPASRPLVTEIKIPSLRSSLLAYRLNIVQKSCTEESELFTPMIRQYLSDPYESKYFVNVKSVDVNLHGTAPYMPPHLKGGSPVSGVSFQIWSDPSCATPVKVDLGIDVLGSMGKLTMAYRIIFAAFQVLTIALVLRKQFQVYDTTGVFISFLESMDLTLRSSLPVFLLALTLLSTSLSSPSYSVLVESPTAWLANSTQASANIDYEKNDMLLGSPDSFFWFLIPLFGAISVGACVVSNYLVVAVTEMLCAVWSIWVNRRGYVKHDEARPDTPTIASTSRSRIINAIILLLFVATVIPYQFAYAIACIVQLTTCMQALYHFKETEWDDDPESHYKLHHIVNIVIAWLVAIHFSGSGLSLKQLDQTLQNAGLVDSESSGRGKKLP
ncbi:hypothetical protein KEM56_007349 [Ascosphaera pollenicola]|nr:hypothetical protein KEM56_007349 [Ascosphaera pollenicola]